MKRQILLYSGGMDSYIVAHMFPDADLLYIDSGSRSSWKEKAMLMHAPRQVEVVPGVIDLSRFEREDAIVPARNLFLVTIASFYGTEILLASTKGDQSTDKDQGFANHMTEALNHIYNCSHFEGMPKISVEVPTKQYTKLDLLEWYINAGYNTDRLLADSVSCYSPQPGHCGRCKACIRKWTALEAAGVPWSGFLKDPADYDWISIIEKIAGSSNKPWPLGWRCPEEDAYTLEVLQEHGWFRD